MSRSPNVSPAQATPNDASLPARIVTSRKTLPTAPRKSLADLNIEFESVLPADVAKQLTNLMRCVIQLGGRRQDLLTMRRRKIEDIVKGTKQVMKLYNEYAMVQRTEEKRVSYRLPVYTEDGSSAKVETRTDQAPKRALQTEVVGSGSNGDAEDESAVTDKPMVEVMLQGRQEKLSVAQERSDDTLQGVIDTSFEGPRSPLSESISGATLREDSVPPAHIACATHTTNPCTIIPIQKPENFPVKRIQEVQAQYYPSTHILAMWAHCTADGIITQITADVEGGSVDHLLINDTRIISNLGLHDGENDVIQPNTRTQARIEETYIIKILEGQRPQNPKAWIVGELNAARHAYLYWLDSRRSADPKTPPTLAEARTLAVQLKRRIGDVMRELATIWDLERGVDGAFHRSNREEYIGEDPDYHQEEVRPTRSWFT